MKLPNHEAAFVEQSKLIDYLLSEDHIVGRTKAKFFRQYGYNESNVEIFKEALLKVARTEMVSEEITSPHGTKYIINGVLETPVRKEVSITTVWIIDQGKGSARFCDGLSCLGIAWEIDMFKELQLVALKHDLKEHNLKSGDVGTIVHCYDDKIGYEVEFVTAEGKTVAVLTLTEEKIRPFEASEILHVRNLTALAA